MINAKDLSKFKLWLQNHGCQILPPTNEWEVLRFRGKETGIFYSSGKTSNQYSNIAYIAYKSNTPWNGGPIKTERFSTYAKEKNQLLERDGSKCFLCGNELQEDITIEHLIALVCGGKNNLDNMVLMHSDCNNKVGAMPIVDKVKLAIKLQK